ncbi:MAG: C-GCAxxG-C-C family protein [Pseudomonadota bacterium]
MTPDEMAAYAVELFGKRMHCSQAVAAAGQKMLGLSQPDVIKALGAFGGGVASSGRICGCLTGGVALVSSLYSRADPSEKESVNMWKLSAKLNRRFGQLTQEFGGVDCRDIAQTDWRDRDQVHHFYNDADSRRQICFKLVADTARALGEILEQAKAEGQL